MAGAWCAATLWGVPASAQDAGALDAGSNAGGGVAADAGTPDPDAAMAEGQLVYPPPGATGVVLNPGLLVVLERTSLASAPPRRAAPDPPALGEGLLLRDDAGAITTAGPLLTLETPRPLGAASAAADSRVEISTQPLELPAATHFEVLSRIAVCAGEDAVRVACLQERYVTIGDFTTGTERDRTAPVVASVTVGPSPGHCLTALHVEASDDHAAPGALRFESFELALLGPDLVFPAPTLDVDERRAHLSLVPIDPSNNRGPTLEVEVEGCPRSDVFDDESDIAPAPSEPVALQKHGGCTFTAGSTRPATACAVLALAALLAARRPRSRRS